MANEDHIRLTDTCAYHPATRAAIRAEAKRQFKVSFVLVTLLTMATIAAFLVTPIKKIESHHHAQIVAQCAAASNIPF